MAPDYSNRGDAPTAFERELLSAVPLDQVREARQLWVVIAQQIGLENLCVILDEIGGTSVSVPSRAKFFRDLWAVRRPEVVLALTQRGLTPTEIARETGDDRSTVSHVLRTIHGTRTRRAGKRAP